MRVLEISAGLGLGGAELSILERLKVSSGNQTIVLSTKPHLDELLSQFEDYVEVKLSKNAFQTLRIVHQISSYFKPDVIICHNPINTILIGFFLKFSKKLELIHVAHSDRFSSSRYKSNIIFFLNKILRPRISGCVAVSFKASTSEQTLGAGKVQIVHLGGRQWFDDNVDFEWPLPGHIHWLAVGRLVRLKNFDTLVKAFAMVSDNLRNKGVSLVIAGEGPRKQWIADYISSNRLQDVICLSPGKSELPSLYHRADLFLITSSYEGGPLTLYEALLAGCLVAGTSVGSVPEFILEDSESRFLRFESAQELSQSLIDLTQLGAVGHKRRLQRQSQFSFLSVSTQSLLFYKAVERIIDKEG